MDYFKEHLSEYQGPNGLCYAAKLGVGYYGHAPVTGMGSTKLAARKDYARQLEEQIGKDRATLVLQNVPVGLTGPEAPAPRRQLYEFPGALPLALEQVHERTLRAVAFRVLQRLGKLSGMVSLEKVSIRTQIPQGRLTEFVAKVRDGKLLADAEVGDFPYPTEQAVFWQMEEEHQLLDTAGGEPSPLHPFGDAPRHFWPVTEQTPPIEQYPLWQVRRMGVGVARRVFLLLPILSTGITSQLLHLSLTEFDALMEAVRLDETAGFLGSARRGAHLHYLWDFGHKYRLLYPRMGEPLAKTPY